MCIKVHEDKLLQQRNHSPAPRRVPVAEVEWAATVEWARAGVAADAAIVSLACDHRVVVSGHLPASANGLAQELRALARREAFSGPGGGRWRTSWGGSACGEILALARRSGLRSLAVLHVATGVARRAWLALVNAGGASLPDDTPLRAIAESIHERCRLQQQLLEARLSSQRLEDVARASGDWSWEIDERYRYTWVHGALAPGAPGTLRAPAIGERIPCGLVVNWLGEPELPLQDFHAVLRQRQAIVRLVTKEPSHGLTRYVSRSAVPLFHPDGRLRGYRGSARDVTQSLDAKAQLWRRDKALRLAKERAEASSQAKSVLVSKVGHELRTPLNAIVGLAQLIQMRGAPADNAAVERWVAQIAKTGWHMVDVLDMLMELGRTGAVNASIASKPIDLLDVVHDALHIVEREAESRAIGITLDAPVPVPATGDRRAICQVVVNLLSNAIKYNRDGGCVRLGVVCGPQARIEIQDTGPGLTPQQLGRLFQPFERLGAESSGIAGHGLGLLICKELVASMQGELQVRSTVGQGTTFTVVLPGPAACPAAGEVPERSRANPAAP